MAGAQVVGSSGPAHELGGPVGGDREQYRQPAVDKLLGAASTVASLLRNSPGLPHSFVWIADDEREGYVGPAQSSKKASEQSGLGCGGARVLERSAPRRLIRHNSSAYECPESSTTFLAQ